jgi:hypothetical protein
MDVVHEFAYKCCGERLPLLNVGSVHDARAQPVAFDSFRMPSQLPQLNYFALSYAWNTDERATSYFIARRRNGARALNDNRSDFNRSSDVSQN